MTYEDKMGFLFLFGIVYFFQLSMFYILGEIRSELKKGLE